MTKAIGGIKMEWNTEKLSRKLKVAYLADDYGDYESLNNMIDSCVPVGYIVRTYSDSVEVFENIEELELNEDDLLTLNEGGTIDIDDVNIQIVR